MTFGLSFLVSSPVCLLRSPSSSVGQSSRPPPVSISPSVRFSVSDSQSSSRLSLHLRFRMASTVEDWSQYGISMEEKDKLVGEVIRYLLFRTHQNLGCPIKRTELTQLVTRNYHQRNLPTSVINEAKEKLSSIFGYEMRELQRSQSSSKNQAQLSQQNVADSKSYVLISQLPPNVFKKYVVDANTAHLNGFTIVIVSIVHLAGGKIPAESLFSHMRRMGTSENEENHPQFGNVKHALELLVQQRYLQKNNVNGPEGNTLFYELAERALDGPVSDKIKEYVSQIVKNDNNAMDDE